MCSPWKEGMNGYLFGVGGVREGHFRRGGGGTIFESSWEKSGKRGRDIRGCVGSYVENWLQRAREKDSSKIIVII